MTQACEGRERHGERERLDGEQQDPDGDERDDVRERCQRPQAPGAPQALVVDPRAPVDARGLRKYALLSHR